MHLNVRDSCQDVSGVQTRDPLRCLRGDPPPTPGKLPEGGERKRPNLSKPALGPGSPPSLGGELIKSFPQRVWSLVLMAGRGEAAEEGLLGGVCVCVCVCRRAWVQRALLGLRES